MIEELRECFIDLYSPPKKEARIFGDWVVEENGNMCYKEYYYIYAEYLNEQDWILHLSGKGWLNWNDFMPAFIHAEQCGNRPIYIYH